MNTRFRRSASIIGGLLLFLAISRLHPGGLDDKASKTLAIAALMILWWITEALPMPVVALLPLVLFPLLGLAKMEAVAAPYANPVIFLFLGGFMIGLAIEKWNLHKRIALNIIRLTGTSGNRIVLGFILSTGFLSMWLSNTATTMMMYPIALSVIHVMEQNHEGEGQIRNLGLCILLSIAYASNLGGIATIIGTPPNVAYVAFLEKHSGYEFQFADWIKLCLPLSLLLMAVLYFVMVKCLYPNKIKSRETTRQMIRDELAGMGGLSGPEKRVLFVFCLTALLWISKDLINMGQTLFRLDDTVIAVLGAVLLFLIPSGTGDGTQNSGALLHWKDTEKMAWGVLLLFGGGISLATQLEQAGLIQRLGSWIAGYASGGFLLVLIVALISIFVSEVMSNVAQVIVFAPVITGVAEALNMSPLILGMAMTLSASCAGMLPMGTPPNAIVFASGRIRLRQMAITGLVMNLVASVLIALFCWYLLPVLVKAL